MTSNHPSKSAAPVSSSHVRDDEPAGFVAPATPAGSLHPAQLRDEAVEWGRKAQLAATIGNAAQARKHIERARQLVLLALQIEEQSK